MLQRRCPPQPICENVASRRESPQIGPMRDGQEAAYFPGLRPQKVAGAKRFGVRQLAAAFPRRKLASGSTSSKLETKKRQQAAALQS